MCSKVGYDVMHVRVLDAYDSHDGEGARELVERVHGLPEVAAFCREHDDTWPEA